MKNLRRSQGFTLIEILVVIGIIAVLAGIVIIAINPARQFAQARNSQRQSNVNAILNAIGQNIADNKGIFVCAGVTIGSPSASSSVGTGGANLESCLVPTYLAGGLPTDPSMGTAADTGYDVSYDSATARYMLCAPKGNEGTASVAQDICVTR